ncbi:hypothetical protein AVEN_155803-1 [Araneus ventricosus]|uniref:Uncharacterized protein n=1 Tax=Araneus ventricosus TaxID=182803 RepID=A0A4Y2R3D9_ARAVE|nr:hypothetical protein AVEN_155803-1 [Araneus ventricosus]
MDRHWESGFWFRYLFYSNSTESIKLVIRNADDSDKQRFIIGENGLHLCQKLIDGRKWFLLELFIAECALSEEAKAKLKDVFMKSGFRSNSRLHERFFHLINTANVEDCSKRSLEDMENEEHENVEHDQGLAEHIKMKRRRRY